MVYELRTYWAHPGKEDAMHARFADHTINLFRAHGMTVVGFGHPLMHVSSMVIWSICLHSPPTKNVSACSTHFAMTRVGMQPRQPVKSMVCWYPASTV